MAVSRPEPFAVVQTGSPQTPVVIGVPHAGRYYPPSVLARARVDEEELSRLEDRHVDAFVPVLADAGHQLVVAHVARAAIDLNRDPDEWERADVAGHTPPTSVSVRTRSGLGVVPRRLSGVGELWRHRLDHIELTEMVERVHRPYHRAIAEALAAARNQFGWAVFLDLHSMPTQPGGGPQIILGDRYGQTAGAYLTDGLLGMVEGEGVSVSRNVPYAGAYGVMHHGSPRRGTDAVQIELDRALYLDGINAPDADGVARMERLLLRMADWASRYAIDVGRMTDAAE